MYRQNPEYFIPIGTDPELAKMIRHQRYINAREHYYTVPYYDNLLISETGSDIQQLALWNALARMKVSEPKGYALLANFYFGTYRSVSSFAKANGISRQAMSRKIKRYLRFLRIIAYEELDRGILKTEYGERILSDCCN